MHFFYFEPEINSCKNISFQNIYFHSFGCFLNLWVTFFQLPGLLLFCFFFRVSFPRRKDSAEDYQTQIALIAGTNWKESIPGAKRICLPVQKLASVPYLTSSGKGAKKPRCCRPLNSALNHTLGRFFLDEVTADRACLVGGGDGGGGAEKTKQPPPPVLDKRDHGGNHPRRRMEIQQSNWCTPPFGWDKIWGTIKHLSRRKCKENEASAVAASNILHNCSSCWIL